MDILESTTVWEVILRFRSNVMILVEGLTERERNSIT